MREDGTAFTLSPRSAPAARLRAAPDGRLSVGEAGPGSRLAFTATSGCTSFPESDNGATGRPAGNPVPFGEVTGWLDAHTHWMRFSFLFGQLSRGPAPTGRARGRARLHAEQRGVSGDVGTLGRGAGPGRPPVAGRPHVTRPGPAAVARPRRADAPPRRAAAAPHTRVDLLRRRDEGWGGRVRGLHAGWDGRSRRLDGARASRRRHRAGGIAQEASRPARGVAALRGRARRRPARLAGYLRLVERTVAPPPPLVLADKAPARASAAAPIPALEGRRDIDPQQLALLCSLIGR